MDLNITEILFSMVNFVIVVVVLKFLLFKPVMKVIDARQAKILSELDEATEQKEASVKLLEDARQEARELRTESERKMDEAVHLAEVKHDELVKEARQSAQAMIAKAEDDIRILRARSLRKEQRAISNLSVDLAARLMGESMDPQTQERLVERFMNEVGADDGTRGQ